MVLTPDYGAADFQNGMGATVNTNLSGSGSRSAVVAWDAVNDTCPAGQFEVQTGYEFVDVNTDQLSVFVLADEGFSFLVP